MLFADPHPDHHRLDALVIAGLAKRGNQVALASNSDELTGNETLAAAEKVAAELKAAGANPGDAVLLAVDNRPHDIVGQLAIWYAGCVAVPVHRPHPALVVTNIAERSGAHFIVGQLPQTWSALIAWTGHMVHTLEGQATGGSPPELDADQALVIFTSGSTGHPKGVVISHHAFASKLKAIDEVFDFTPNAVMLQVLHLHFSFGQWTTLLTLASAGRVDLVSRFSTDAVLERLAERTYDRIAVVPTMMRMIETRLGNPQLASTLTTMRQQGSPQLWIAGGEPLAAGLGRYFRELLPHSNVTDVFGLSESATSDFIVRPEHYDQQAGTIGHPAPNVQFRVVVENDHTFVDADPNEPGELWLKTPHLMTGYLGDQEATTETMHGPWLRTGDLAARRPDGLLELVGRAKNLIVRGGIKVSPLEVENVYSTHPHCSGVIATGVADAILGERIHLVVTARAGHLVEPDEVREWGRSRIDPGKVVDHVHVVDEIPLGVTGKTDRIATAALVERICQRSV